MDCEHFAKFLNHQDIVLCLATSKGGFASFISVLEAEHSNTKHPMDDVIVIYF